MERPLEVPKVGDMFHPKSASEDLCKGIHPRLRQMMAEAPVIPRSKVLKSGRTIGGAQGWGHESLDTCQ